MSFGVGDGLGSLFLSRKLDGFLIGNGPFRKHTFQEGKRCFVAVWDQSCATERFYLVDCGLLLRISQDHRKGGQGYPRCVIVP